MIHKIAFSFLLFTVASTAIAQTTETATRTRRPDIPGTFVVEFGFNRDYTGPSNFSLDFWGSRTVNVYYQYDLRIAKSKFSLVPGLGLSMERLNFKKGRTFQYNSAGALELVLPATYGLDIRKSQLVTNYVDLPVEFRYTSKPDDPARAFKAGVGGRIGYMYDSFTKLKYKSEGETLQLKDKRDWNLNKLRYGVFAKVNFGNFGLFGYYNMTNLFESGKGPYIPNETEDFPTFTAGISLSSF
jgi:hypothetical protein